MSRGRPTASEERWLAVRARFGQAVAPEDLTGGWTTANTFPRLAFFFLGALSVGALWGFAAIVAFGGGSVGGRGWQISAIVSGLISVAVGEGLIWQKRMFQSGVEEALFACGMLMIVMGSVIHDSIQPVTVSVALAVVLVVIGFRLLNPLFTTLGAWTLSWALHEAFNGVVVAAIYWAAAVVAGVLLTRTTRRPSTEKLLSMLAIVLPVVAWVYARDLKFDAWEWQWTGADARTRLATLAPVIVAAFAAFAIALGLRKRIHAPILSGMVSIAILAFELRNLTGASLAQRFLIGGTLTLIAAVALERMLRSATAGITSRQLSDDSEGWKVIELAAASAMASGKAQPSSGPPAPPTMEGGGGGFGGGGASGGY